MKTKFNITQSVKEVFKNMKITRILIFSLLLAAMTFALLPAAAHAEEGVTEQYNLTPGGTYYFDLSGENIPGTVTEWLPDHSLRWVPFTYVGTINAYSLDPSASGDPWASTAASANPSDRSLFVAEYAVTTEVTWDALNGQNLIFGRDYESGGVSYTLRSLSAGSSKDHLSWGESGTYYSPMDDPVEPPNNGMGPDPSQGPPLY